MSPGDAGGSPEASSGVDRCDQRKSRFIQGSPPLRPWPRNFGHVVADRRITIACGVPAFCQTPLHRLQQLRPLHFNPMHLANL